MTDDPMQAVDAAVARNNLRLSRAEEIARETALDPLATVVKRVAAGAYYVRSSHERPDHPRRRFGGYPGYPD